MSRRQISLALAGALVTGALSLLPLSTASAEPTATPALDDIVGVGSDTSQFALNFLADGATVDGAPVDGYNAGRSSAFLRTFDALGAGLSSTIVPKQGAPAITRPNGSGAGKATLYGGGNNTNINFARSSSSLSDAEISANLWQTPFAVDGLKLAVRAAGSNAPTKISPADMVKIYNGTFTNWNQLGGTAGAIKPLVPQTGSGTRTFFLSQLKAANGGVDVALAASVTETQEHSDADIKNDVNAVAPFSTGRALSTSTVKLLDGSSAGGFEANRALYNVVRQADLSSGWFASIFDDSGFLCSTAAKPLIEHAGFQQLARPADGGVCGSATQATTTDFDTNQDQPAVDTTTTLTASANKQKVTLTATVASTGGTPVGSVDFMEGATEVGSANLSGGVGIATLDGVAPGNHTYTAVYTPTAAEDFNASESSGKSVTVEQAAAPSKTTVTVPGTFKTTQRVNVVVKVTTGGASAAGQVKVMEGKKSLGQGNLRAGKVTIKLPKLSKGKHKLVFKYAGNASTKASQASETVTVKKR